MGCVAHWMVLTDNPNLTANSDAFAPGNFAGISQTLKRIAFSISSAEAMARE